MYSAVLQEVSDTNKNNFVYLGIRHKWLNVNIFVFQIHFIC